MGLNTQDLHKMPVPAELEGESWVPLLEKSSANSTGKQRVFSQYPHSLRENASLHGFKNESGTVMGYSMRTPLWRYTEVITIRETPFSLVDKLKIGSQFRFHESDDLP